MKTCSVLLTIVLCATAIALGGDVKGKVTAKGARDNGNAVVFIEKIPGKTFEAPKKHAEIDQKNLVFLPHVLPILAGTTVDFINSDDVMHNVFSPDKCADKFNLGTWPRGQKRSYTFKQTGCIAAMLCNVHPEMEAYIVVLENPYYAVSSKDGSYVIKNVPPGKYMLKIWHEKLKGEPVSIEVSGEGDVTQNFVVKR